MQNDDEDARDLFKLTADQKLLLARFPVPTDIAKYVCELARFIFTADELKENTANKLNPVKVSFITRKYQIVFWYICFRAVFKVILRL